MTYDLPFLTFVHLAFEAQTNNIFRHFYIQRLQRNQDAHNIDIGAAVVPADKRPPMKTRAQNYHSTVF